MVVKTKLLKLELDRYNQLVDNYYGTVLQLNQNLSFSSNYWHDSNSLKFFDNQKKEKLKNLKLIEELNEIKNIYAFIYEKYSEIGEVIECELNNKTLVLNSFDAYLNKLGEIINLYNSLNLQSNIYGYTKLIAQKNMIKNDYSKIVDAKNNVNEYFKKIEQIENEVKYKISKIKISYLKESEYHNYL